MIIPPIRQYQLKTSRSIAADVASTSCSSSKLQRTPSQPHSGSIVAPRSHSLKNVVLENHIPSDPKRDPLPLFLTRHLDPRHSSDPRTPLGILPGESSTGKDRLPPVLARRLHVLFPLDRGDRAHPGLGAAPDGLVEGEEEGVVVLAGFGTGREERVEEGEEVGFACSWWARQEDSLQSWDVSLQQPVQQVRQVRLPTLGTSNSANSSSPLNTLTRARSRSSLLSGAPRPLRILFHHESRLADSRSRLARTGASGLRRRRRSRGGE